MVSENSTRYITNDEKKTALQQGEPLHFSVDLIRHPSAEARSACTIQASWLEEFAKNHPRSVGVPIDISHAIIEGPLRLHYTTFECGFSITDSEFTDEIDLSFATFKQLARFERTHFRKTANFRTVRAQCDFESDDACFYDEAIFSFGNIKGLALFNQATFAGPALFTRTRFESEAVFQGANFVRDAHFQGIVVDGNLVLCSDAVSGPVSFGGLAWFEMATLNGNVNFTGVQFGGQAIFFGMKVKGDILFAPDQQGNSARFYDTANFQKATVEGQLKFIQAEFLKSVSFVNTRVESSAIFIGTRFAEDASFGRFNVASGIIFGTDNQSRPVYFGGKLNFIDAHIEGEATFESTQFMKEALFDRVRVDGAAFFRVDEYDHPVHFGGLVSFSGAHIIGQVVFDQAEFCDLALFLNAHFEAEASFRGAQFMKEASFDRIRIGGGAYFRPDDNSRPVCFRGNVRFHGSHIHGDATFTSAKFEQKTEFDGVQIDGNIFFRPDDLCPSIPTQFSGLARFHNARILGSAEFQDSQFKEAKFDNAYFRGPVLFCSMQTNEDSPSVLFEGPATFTAAIFDSVVTFNNAEFRESATFDSAHFKLLAIFSRAKFKGEVTFGAMMVERDAHYEQTQFSKRASFREAYMHTVFFCEDKQGLPVKREAQFLEDVDLRGFTYERISVKWQDLFAKLHPYDRQPYEYLEKVMRLVGQDNEADSLYFDRRKSENRQRWRKVFRKHNTDNLSGWPAVRELLLALFNGFQRMLFGYGVRAHRLLWISLLVILIGAYLFSLPDAVRLKDNDNPLNNSQVGSQVLNQEPIQLSCTQALGVSFRLFIPVVEIPSGSLWVPSEKPAPFLKHINLSFAGYATFHRLAGVILVPLGIAAATGLLYRRKKG